MLSVTMDPDIIKGLDPAADYHCHRKAVAYFEQLKSSNEGLEYCAATIANGIYAEDHVNFFLWQVFELQIKHRYVDLPLTIKSGIRTTLLTWVQNYVKNSPSSFPAEYLRNKVAQVFALVFAREYLHGWPTFIRDVMMTALEENITEFGANIYLKILLAIDSEVVDRTIDHTAEVQNHNQLLKDTMRERCVTELVNSWIAMLSVGSSNSEENICLCLQVVGAYIAWIDIGLIANDRAMTLILNFLHRNHSSRVREAACDCLKEVAIKGMLPADKLSLIETLWSAVQSSGVQLLLNVEKEIDFVIKLSRLASSMVSTLIFAWNRQTKLVGELNQNDKTLSMLVLSIDSKMPVCLQFFEHDDDDVSAQCIDLIRDYLDMLKRTQPLNEVREIMVEKLLYALVKKLKYDEEYNFTKEGEEEAEFQEFLRNIKVIYDNLAMLCPQLVLRSVYSILSSTLAQWQSASFNDIEVAIRLLYMLGETIPSNISTQFSPDKNKTSPLHDMMTLLVTSGVSNHPHAAVRLQFFETVARYDRYFPAMSSAEQQSSVIASTTQAFFDHRGLRSPDPKLRSRCAYLMSRYVKTLGKLLSPYAEEILNEVDRILVLSPVNGIDRLLSSDDQLFIFELAGNLVINSHFEPDKKAVLMTALLRPLVENFQPVLNEMKILIAKEIADSVAQQTVQDTVKKSEIYANALGYMMSYASRTSKAFSGKQTMSQSGCAVVYTDALKVFLQALDIDAHRSVIHTGVRQYLHRMVICLEEEVLPFIPVTIHHLLSNQESKSLHDFLPLLNQVISKFKKTIEPFLREVFMLVVRAIFDVLSRQSVSDISIDDVKTIRRSYFQFLHALVANNVAQVILTQADSDLDLVLNTLVQGAVESVDAVAQKTCFSVLTKLVQSWGADIKKTLQAFVEESAVPACFIAPMASSFDLSDAQTILALNESASFMKAVYKIRGLELENFLRQRYLPSLQLPQEKIEEYCQALKTSDNRGFRTYVKAFFTQAKT